MLRTLGLLLACGTLVSGCSARELDLGAVRASGEFIEITCDFDCDRFAPEAARYADASVRASSDFLGVPPAPVGTVHLARDAEAYARIERAITRGKFETNLAFANPSRRLAVVAVQPPVSDSALTSSDLPMQTLRLVAHESSHLVSYSVMRRGPNVPSWIEEGLATLVEAEVRAALGVLPSDPYEDPLLSTYYLRTQRARGDGRLPSVGAFTEGDYASLSGGETYAVQTVLARALHSSDPVAFRTALAAVREAYAAGMDGAEISRAFVAGFGGADLMTSAWHTHMDAAQPRWNESLRSLDVGGDVWIHRPFSSGAQAVRLDPSGESWRLRLGVRTRGRDPVGAVTLRANDTVWGFVRISRDAVELVQNEPREVLVSVPLDPGRGDAFVPVELVASPTALSLRVASEAVGAVHPIDIGSPLSGPWGLLVRPGGWIEWKGVSFVRYAP